MSWLLEYTVYFLLAIEELFSYSILEDVTRAGRRKLVPFISVDTEWSSRVIVLTIKEAQCEQMNFPQNGKVASSWGQVNEKEVSMKVLGFIILASDISTEVL